jgi:hypothetical protein
MGAVVEAPAKKEVDSFFDVKRENITVHKIVTYHQSINHFLKQFFYLKVR